jgi:hypothetical protein
MTSYTCEGCHDEAERLYPSPGMRCDADCDNINCPARKRFCYNCVESAARSALGRWAVLFVDAIDKDDLAALQMSQATCLLQQVGISKTAFIESCEEAWDQGKEWDDRERKTQN